MASSQYSPNGFADAGSRYKRLLTLLITALLIGGCRYDDIDTRWGLDFDGDGVAFSADCDDEDPARYPGADDNVAMDYGGGIYLIDGDIHITGGRFHKNISEGHSGEGGGAIAIEIGSITAVGTSFT